MTARCCPHRSWRVTPYENWESWRRVWRQRSRKWIYRQKLFTNMTTYRIFIYIILRIISSSVLCKICTNIILLNYSLCQWSVSGRTRSIIPLFVNVDFSDFFFLKPICGVTASGIEFLGSGVYSERASVERGTTMYQLWLESRKQQEAVNRGLNLVQRDHHRFCFFGIVCLFAISSVITNIMLLILNVGHLKWIWDLFLLHGM